MTTVNYNELAVEYARHRRLHPEVLRVLADGVSPGSRVLEVGCGTGNYVSALAELTRCACWGIDPSEEMLAQAAARSPAVTFRRADAEHLPFADGSFDRLFSVDVIHHVPTPAAFFREAWRVLQVGGDVWTATDSADIIRSRQPLATYFPETVDVDLARYPTIDQLQQDLAAAGFQQLQQVQVEFRGQVTDIAPYRNRAYSCLHLISAEAWQQGLERMERDLAQGPLPAVSQYCLVGGVKLRAL